MSYVDDEIPKHKKKAHTTVKKSGHKHMSKECLLSDSKSITRAEYCTICGKISNKFFFEMVPYKETSSRFATDQEIKEMYNHLEIFVVEDVCRTKKIQI